MSATTTCDVTSDVNSPKISEEEGHTDNSHTRGRSKIIISIFEKLNMLFLLFLVCYLSLTIPANYGLFSSSSDKESSTKNSSVQDETSKFQSEDLNSTNRIVIDSLFNSTDFPRKLFNIIGYPKPDRPFSSKWRRKKKLKRKKFKGPTTNSSVEWTANNNILSLDPREKQKKKNRRKKKKKFRKRKKTKTRFENKLKPTTIRHIIEKVAQEALTRPSGSWDYSEILRKGSPEVVTTITNDIDVSNENKEHVYGPWSSWGPCSVTCGNGQRERTRVCSDTCKEMETMVCYKPSCLGKGRKGKKKGDVFMWGNAHFTQKHRNKDYIDPEVDACGKWMECNAESISTYLNHSSLPSCPCKYPLHLSYNTKVWDHERQEHFNWKDIDDKKESFSSYKLGAQFCIRSDLFKGTQTLAAQTCCYDHMLKLITRGKGAGTPNLISPEISPELHQKLDISPWIICKGDWTRYNQILPPNNDRDCDQNPDDSIIKQQIEEAQNF